MSIAKRNHGNPRHQQAQHGQTTSHHKKQSATQANGGGYLFMRSMASSVAVAELRSWRYLAQLTRVLRLMLGRCLYRE